MGSDDLFKKKKESRKERRAEFKNARANSFLIVTEGEKTEPLYFGGLKELIIEKCGGNIDIYKGLTIDIEGEGRSTKALIGRTEELISKAKIIYQNVWLVFDKDDFKDFDEAIKVAYEKGYKVAWSNQAFEYWLNLHFHYSDSALRRNIWSEKLANSLKKNRYQFRWIF